MNQSLLIFAAIAFIFGLFSNSLKNTYLSGPILFVLAGLLAGPFGLNILDLEIGNTSVGTFAELTLALVLFGDASLARFSIVGRNVKFPERLLLIGLPLTLLLGIGVGSLVFNSLSLYEIAILAIILAPTDAALGKPVVSNPAIPARIRESLNIESGLNDGICVPFLLLVFALMDRGSNVTGMQGTMFFVKAIGIGMLIGLTLTYAGNWLIRKSMEKNWMDESWERIIIVTLAFLIYGLAGILGGSGFIACFSGGLLFGVIQKRHKQKLILAVEGISDLFSLITWGLFGSIIVYRVFSHITWQTILYAVLSLTLIRMLPVYLSLVRTDLNRYEKLFIGWFGPRGLATIVFIYLALEHGVKPDNPLVSATIFTILLSIVLHGSTAKLITDYYKRTNKFN